MKEHQHLEASFSDSFRDPTLMNVKMPDLAGAHDIVQLQRSHYSTNGNTVEISNLVQDRLSIKMGPPVPNWALSLVFSFLPRSTY
jgi:hypothetical protein